MTGSLHLGSVRPGCSWLLVAPAGAALGLDDLHLFRLEEAVSLAT